MLNGSELDVLAQSATFSSSEGQHDQATITVSSPTLTTTDGLTDQPVSFRWGVPPRLETFNGYVMDVKEETAQGSGVSLSFTMSLLGATKAMFDGKPHFWTNKAIPSAVRDLVAQNQLGYTGHAHTYLWPALAQTERERLGLRQASPTGSGGSSPTATAWCGATTRSSCSPTRACTRAS